MAFTPINSSDAVTGTDIHDTAIQEGNPQVASNHDDAATTTVASAYLGRGELPKKCTTKSRKRTANEDASSRTKRRQKSNIDVGLKVSKAKIDGEQGAINNEGDSPATFQTMSTKPSKDRFAARQLASTTTLVSTAMDEHASTAANPISVYAPTTTMEALDTTSLPTSVECAKASDGQGFTLYQGPSSTYSSSVAISNPATARKQLQTLSTNLTGEGGAKGNSETRASNRRSARLKNAADVQIDAADRAELSGSVQLPIIVDDFEEEFPDIDMANFGESNVSEGEPRPNTPPARGRKLNTRDVDELEDYGGALPSEADRRALATIQSSMDNVPKPIVRKPFPPSILDRSPIFGASQGVVLRTCFRVGEALVTGSHAVRNGKDVVIELYARVTSSWREPSPGRKQYMIFKDLYHDNPPYLEGTFELWQQSQLWDLDSKEMLESSNGAGVMCRAIARMRRDGQKWRLEVLSVWEASWDDINFAVGICK